jgi:HEAT repeat protein
MRSGRLTLRFAMRCGVLADERAAARLLKKANQHVSGEQGEWLQRSHAMRALSTCATKELVSPLVSYITSEPKISIYLPVDTIRPLIMRGLLTPSELKDIIRNPSGTTYGRVACLQTLALVDPVQHADIFTEIAFHQDNEILQDHAIQALGDLGKLAVATNLRNLLNDTQSVSLAHTIAHALAEIKSVESVSDIIKTRSRFAGDATAFNIALARLGERSALKPLLEVVAGDRFLAGEVLDAVGLFLPDAQAQRAVLQKLESFSSSQLDTGEQSSAITVLARRDRRLLIDRVSALYESGRLHKSACRQLGFLMPDLIKKEGEGRSGLIELMKRLLCDSNFEVRRTILDVLFRVDADICGKLYNDLKNGDEWSRACAVSSLGFWESPEHWINEARRDRELVIRRAADGALAARSRTDDLIQLIRLYQSDSSLDRLAAYLALGENGDYPTLWRLYDTINESSLAYVFLRELSESVKKNSDERQRKAQKEEEDFFSSRGTVKFA